MNQQRCNGVMRLVECKHAIQIHIKNQISVDKEKVIVYAVFQIVQRSRCAKWNVLLNVVSFYPKPVSIPEIRPDHFPHVADGKRDPLNSLSLQTFDLMLENRLPSDEK